MDGKAGTGHLVRSILRNRETKNVFVFVVALGVYACVQALYGIYVDSLGLIADSFHNAFHCIGLTISLAGMIYSEMQPSFAFSYGYDRHEVLAAFSNALFLIFLCLFVIMGAIHRYFEPSHIQPTARILEFGVASLAINLAGALTLTGATAPGSGHSLDYAHKFSDAVSGPGSAGSATLLTIFGLAGGATGGGGLPLPVTATGGGARAHNVRAVRIMFVSHVLSSTAVILSSLLLRFYGIVWADTLQSVLVSLVTLTLAVPLFTSTGMMLLQAAPATLRPALDRARREASVLEGVTEVADEHFWSQSPGNVVGSLVVRTTPGADTQAILGRVRRAYARVPVHDLTVQVEREPEFVGAAVTAGLGSGLAAAMPVASGGHGHSHGPGGTCSGHGHGHGHGGSSSSGASTDAAFTQRFVAPAPAPAAPVPVAVASHGHGHSHGSGGDHGHSHSARSHDGGAGHDSEKQAHVNEEEHDEPGRGHGHSHGGGASHGHGHGGDREHGHSHI